jgi:hypothetical protein
VPQPRAIVKDQGGIRVGLNSTGSTIAKYRLVVKSTAAVDAVAPGTAATAPIYGVTMGAIEDGKTGDIQVEGRALVEASAAIAIGARVTGTTGGKGVTAGAAGYFLGIAASAASADGDVIEVDIQQGVTPA